MKYQETCECCGHIETAYTLPLNASLVRAFVKFAEMYYAGSYKGLKKGEIGLTNSQYGNFQRLVHFGIIEQDEETKRWHITSLGKDFYNNAMPLLSPAGHFKNQTLPKDHHAWTTHDKPRREYYISDVFPERYKKREEYQEEKSVY